MSRRQHGPRRQLRRIQPALWLADMPALPSLALAVWRRIKQARYGRGTGTVVACDGQAVYLLAAGEPRTECFISKHAQWVVGTYATTPASGDARVPSVDMLLDDLAHALPQGYPSFCVLR